MIKKKLGLKKIKNNHLSMGLVLFMLLMLFCEKPGFKEGWKLNVGGSSDDEEGEKKKKSWWNKDSDEQEGEKKKKSWSVGGLNKRDITALGSAANNAGDGKIATKALMFAGKEGEGVGEGEVINCMCLVDETDKIKITAMGDFHKLTDEEPGPSGYTAIGSATVTCNNVMCNIQCENKKKCGKKNKN